jgi:hypothetical protein
MAGSRRSQYPRSIWRLPGLTAWGSVAWPRDARPITARARASSIFRSATFLTYESKIAEASWSGHDKASAPVTTWRLGRPGEPYATES